MAKKQSSEIGFDVWMRKVSAHVERIVGLGADDLADMPYRAWYDDGMSPSEAARQALAEEGFNG